MLIITIEPPWNEYLPHSLTNAELGEYQFRFTFKLVGFEYAIEQVGNDHALKLNYTLIFEICPVKELSILLKFHDVIIDHMVWFIVGLIDC